jgi:hypothetical protein
MFEVTIVVLWQLACCLLVATFIRVWSLGCVLYGTPYIISITYDSSYGVILSIYTHVSNLGDMLVMYIYVSKHGDMSHIRQ